MSYKEIQQVEQSRYSITQGDLHKPVKTDDGFMCQICSNDASGNFYSTGFMLCVLCADYVANVYTIWLVVSLQHGRLRYQKIEKGIAVKEGLCLSL